ncbi:hypothetical protein, partial [uncultured Bilophila sp.]|uniref:hypothetical protein n=1 Tax=uncultured Bilophila sp. TaxID=529385 RepID=UPI00262217F1
MIDSFFSSPEFQRFSILLKQQAPRCGNSRSHYSEITEEIYPLTAMTEFSAKKTFPHMGRLFCGPSRHEGFDKVESLGREGG